MADRPAAPAIVVINVFPACRRHGLPQEGRRCDWKYGTSFGLQSSTFASATTITSTECGGTRSTTNIRRSAAVIPTSTLMTRPRLLRAVGIGSYGHPHLGRGDRVRGLGLPWMVGTERQEYLGRKARAAGRMKFASFAFVLLTTPTLVSARHRPSPWLPRLHVVDRCQHRDRMGFFVRGSLMSVTSAKQ